MGLIRRLLRWLRLQRPLPPLQILEGGKLVDVIPLAAVGMMLQVRSGRGQRLVGESHTSDRRLYWRWWQRLREGQPPLTWDDGRRFQPPVR